MGKILSAFLAQDAKHLVTFQADVREAATTHRKTQLAHTRAGKVTSAALVHVVAVFDFALTLILNLVYLLHGHNGFAIGNSEMKGRDLPTISLHSVCSGSPWDVSHISNVVPS